MLLVAVVAQRSTLSPALDSSSSVFVRAIKDKSRRIHHNIHCLCRCRHVMDGPFRSQQRGWKAEIGMVRAAGVFIADARHHTTQNVPAVHIVGAHALRGAGGRGRIQMPPDQHASSAVLEWRLELDGRVLWREQLSRRGPVDGMVPVVVIL